MSSPATTQRLSHRDHDACSEIPRRLYKWASPEPLSRAYDNARMPGDLSDHLRRVGEGLGAMRRAVILADRAGRILWLSGLAREWLGEFFPDYVDRSGLLPTGLKRPLVRSGRQEAERRFGLSETQTCAVGEFRLMVCHGECHDGSVVIALARERESIDPALAAGLHLTGREAQTLFWISEAKTNPQIAAILGISPRTVHKHVEHILEKLALENRLEAQRLAWELRRL
jgi:DNA-binding CsgD family transcriptional regulator